MFTPEGNLRVWLCTTPTDMRRSFNGLSAMVKRDLSDNPLSGALYVFVNRRRTQMKILYFDGDGYAVSPSVRIVAASLGREFLY